jgi:hypothetical protein
VNFDHFLAFHLKVILHLDSGLLISHSIFYAKTFQHLLDLEMD